jgi:hypothetical protein
MPQTGQDRGFFVKLTGEFFGCEEILFDRDTDIEVGIPGLVHSTHAALTQDAFDPIPMVQGFTAFEGHDKTGRRMSPQAAAIVANGPSIYYAAGSEQSRPLFPADDHGRESAL